MPISVKMRTRIRFALRSPLNSVESGCNTFGERIG